MCVAWRTAAAFRLEVKKKYYYHMGMTRFSVSSADKGSFNNYVDKKRGVDGQNKVHGSHVTCYMYKYMFAHSMGEGVKIG